MKKLYTTVILGIILLSFSACSTQPAGLSTKPVIKQGATTDYRESTYITLIPKGTKIPFNVNLKGNAFNETIQKSFPVVLKHDTYVYGNTNESNIIWVSHDKIHWYTLDEAFEGQIMFTIDNTPKKSSMNFSLIANRKIQ